MFECAKHIAIEVRADRKEAAGMVDRDGIAPDRFRLTGRRCLTDNECEKWALRVAVGTKAVANADRGHIGAID